MGGQTRPDLTARPSIGSSGGVGSAQELIPVERALLDYGLDGEDTSQAPSHDEELGGFDDESFTGHSKKPFSRLRGFTRSDPVSRPGKTRAPTIFSFHNSSASQKPARNSGSCARLPFSDPF